MKKNVKRLIALLAVLCMVIAQMGVVAAEDAQVECQHVFNTVYDNDNCVEPTCTEKGYGHRVCALCGIEYEPQPYINVEPLGHDWSGEVEIVPEEDPANEDAEQPATCVADGYFVRTTTLVCAREGCGEVLKTDTAYVTIPATGVHTWGERMDVPGSLTPAKCVEGGSYDTAIFCTVCGIEKEGSRETVEIDSLGHQPAAPVQDPATLNPSTCIVPGTVDMVTYCDRCHIELSRETVNLDLAAHTWPTTPVIENFQDSTCVDYATYDRVWYCTVCGTELNREFVDEEFVAIPAYPLKAHQWELDLDNPNYVAPTCYAEGTGYYFCTVCGAKNDDQPIAKVDHNYGPVVEVPATCMDQGGKIQECQNVGCTAAAEGHFNYIEVYEINPDGHKWELAPVDPNATPEDIGVSASRAATCTKYGVNAYVCAYNETHRKAEQTPPVGHDEVILPAVKPTCEGQGWTAGLACNRQTADHSIPWCDATGVALPGAYTEAVTAAGGEVPEYVTLLRAPQVIPATGHTVLDILVPDSATCTEGGEITYKCAVCGEEVTEETDPLGHNWQIIDADYTPETCSTNGYVSKRCLNCGEELRETVPANGEHDFSDWIEEPASCKEAGRVYRFCYTCGYEDVQEFIPVDPDAHWYEPIWDENDPDFDIKRYPSCTETGLGKVKCQVCGKTKYAILPENGHEWIDIPGIDATCTEPGLTGGRFCMWCDEEEEGTEIPALGHEWGDEEVTKEATCTEAGIMNAVCERCGELGEDIEIPALGHEWGEAEVTKEATCTEAGVMNAVCEVCGEVGEDIEIPALGHDWELEDAVEPTCVATGKLVWVCAECGEEDTDELEKGDHTWIRWRELDVAPSCVSGGADAYVCYYCDARKYEVSGKADPTAHVWVKLEQISVPTCVSGALDLYACYFCDARVIKESETSKADPTNHVWCDVGDQMACYYCDATKAK